MAKVRDYGKLAADIKDLIGESNILGATHCATRLRLILKEEPSDEITKKIEQKPGVIQVVKAGGQYQIVIGMHAKDVYEELSKIMTFAEDAPQAKVGLLDRLIAIMSGSITPFVYVLAGAGLLQGTLIILRLIIGEDVINPSGIGQLDTVHIPAGLHRRFGFQAFQVQYLYCSLVLPGAGEPDMGNHRAGHCRRQWAEIRYHSAYFGYLYSYGYSSDHHDRPAVHA